MRVLITGAGGQVGSELVATFSASGHEVFSFSHAQLDITSRDAVRAAVVEAHPDAIVHPAAWTAVDACESDPDRAFLVNALATRFISEAAAMVDAPVHFVSTDYVFDGTKPTPYVEWDQVAPNFGLRRLETGGGARTPLRFNDHSYVLGVWLQRRKHGEDHPSNRRGK